MELQDGRVSVQLDITNYQFPHVDNESWDSDWLTIRLHLQYGDRTWTHDDPALVTRHLTTFASWRHQRLTTRITFTEPNLSFEVLNHHPTGAPAALRVYLDLECRLPFFALLDHVGPASHPDEVWINFPLDEHTLRRTTSRLHEQLGHHPVRVGLPHVPPTA
jgi:hypothetical protein